MIEMFAAIDCKKLMFLVLAITAQGPIAFAKAAKKTAKVEAQDINSLKLVEGDEKSNEEKALKTELMISRTEAKAIEQSKALIQKYKGSMLEADLQFRLAELYMRRAKTARFFEMNRESETVVRLAPQIVANVSSRKQIESAITTYDYIQKHFPRFNQLDLVIFNNAFARQQVNQEREAERLYWLLIKNFPGSILLPDAYLAIGEINFDRSNFSFALEHFNAIKKFPESRVFPYGLYKAAWSLYNMRDAQGGLKKLEEVVAYGKYVYDNKIEQRLDLRKEALADMTIFYEEVLPAKNAFSYFRKQASDLDVGPYILKLAKLYEHHSRYEDRQVVLNDFIKMIPDSQHVASIHGELIWNYDSMKRRDLAVKQMLQLHELCDPGSRWIRSQRDNKEINALELCRSTLADSSLKLAGRWLKIWKKDPNQQSDFADSAEKAFSIFLTGASDTAESAEARFAFAELLFQRQKFRQASMEYAKVSRSPNAGKHQHDSAYGAVVSLEKAAGEKWNDTDEKNFQELVKYYVTSNPKGAFRLDLEFKVALIAYDKSRYEEAGPIFLRLGNEYASSEKGKKAQDLYLDILNLKKEFKSLKEYAGELAKQESDKSRKDKLTKIHQQSYFLEVQSTEESGNYQAAIQGYKDFAKANEKSELAEKAWWNAVQLHYKVFDLAAGAKASLDYADRYPNSKNRLDSLLKSAETYESLGQLEPAAEVLLRIAKLDTSNAVKWNSLAADFYLLCNQFTKGKRLLLDLKANSDLAVRAMALDKLITLERVTGTQTSAYRDLLKAIIAAGVQPQASLAKVEMIEEQFRVGQASDAFNEAKKIVGLSNAAPSAKSRARMIQALVLEDEFLKASVKSRAEKVATVLAIKTEKLEKAQQAFQQAIKYGDPKVTVDGLAHLAFCYTHYIDALKKMPNPTGLSEAEGEAFRNEISQLSIPLEEKAIETLQDGIRTAQRLHIENASVNEMKKQLKELNMPMPIAPTQFIGAPGILLPTVAGVGP